MTHARHASASGTPTMRSRPFLEAPGVGDEPSRRLLLVSCAFPPHTSVGALRWQKMSRFAAQRGWGLDVITLAPTAGGGAQPSAVAELAPWTRVYGVQVLPPLLELPVSAWRQFRTTLGWRRNGRATKSPQTIDARPSALDTLRQRYHAIAEFRRMDAWISEAVKVGASLVGDGGGHRWVVSSGPPHMAHEAARLIAQRARLPHAMDMRDLWNWHELVPEDMHAATWLRRARRDEQRCVDAARLVITNTEEAGHEMRQRYPHLGARVLTVLNGADDDAIPTVARDDRFQIAFAGSLYVGRDPRPFFAAVRRVVSDLELSPTQFGLSFMGGDAYRNVPLAVLAEEAGVASFFTSLPVRPRKEALEFLARATMLVNLPQDVRVAIPAKLFEYVRFDAWILVLSEPGTATEALMRRAGADVISPNDIGGMAALIRRRYEEFRSGVRPRALNADGRFDRVHQANVLLDALERALDAQAN